MASRGNGVVCILLGSFQCRRRLEDGRSLILQRRLRVDDLDMERTFRVVRALGAMPLNLRTNPVAVLSARDKFKHERPFLGGGIRDSRSTIQRHPAPTQLVGRRDAK